MFIPESKKIYNHLKSSAKKRNIPFDLTIDQLNNFTFPLTCPITGVKLKYKGSLEDNTYSFDRIDSSKGYTIDNLIIISWRANKLKNNATIKELKQLAEFYTNLF